MKEVRYIISDASRKLKVEPHVLRYWEEELHLDIPRNEMGHRHYTEENMELLSKIKNLKEKGFQLKAIKLALPQIDQIDKMDEVNLYRLREELNLRAEGLDGSSLAVVKPEAGEVAQDPGQKMEQFKNIMRDLISDAIRENTQILSTSVSENISDNVIKEMDYLIRDKEEKEEERFRHLDEVIRGMQKTRQEAAAADSSMTKKKKERKKLFGRKNKQL